jgi:hypothetical protein
MAPIAHPRIARRSHGVTLAEALIALAVGLAVLAIAFGLFRYGRFALARIGPRSTVQQNARRALVRTLRELQQGMEVVSPRPGSTLTYAVVRDQRSLLRWYYQLPQALRPGTYELWRFVDDDALAPARRHERLLSDVRRLTFTCRSEGAVQLHLVLEEEGQEQALLTTIRLRNLASAEELW